MPVEVGALSWLGGFSASRNNEPKAPGRPRFVGLAVVALFLVAGCASGGKPKPESADQGPPPDETAAVAEVVSVGRLTDGREGFIISERSGMGAEAGSDFERAVAMLKDQDYDQAIELLEKVIKRAPGVTAPHINIAIAYKHVDKLEQAEQHLKSALGLVPEHPVASNEYGLLLRKTGRFAEARAVYEKTLKTFPDYHPARRNLGILCDLYLNDLGCALEHYELYSEAVPKDEQVKIWIADLRARLGR